MARKSKGQAQDRQKAKKRPLSSHPLFPAVVALWFGSLFGLGSLAVRPALIEALVLKLHIDVILPFAAPPLGIKARVLMALVMAIGGGMIGIALGRAINRPKQKAVKACQQRHTILSGLMGHGRETPQPRRRPLAIHEDHGPNYHAEFAPLPGGQPQILPQILDVTEFDFTQADEAGETVAEQAMHQLHVTVHAEPNTLDLAGFISSEPVAHPVANETQAITAQVSSSAVGFAAAQADLADQAMTPDREIPSPEPANQFRPFDASPLPHSPDLADVEPTVEAHPTEDMMPVSKAPAAVSADGAMNHADLVERLARSMRERRERLARSHPQKAAAIPHTSRDSLEPATPHAVGLPVAAPAIPEKMDGIPPSISVQAEHVESPSFSINSLEVEDQPFEKPDANEDRLASTHQGIQQLPAAFRPLPLDDPEPTPDDFSHVPARTIAIPAAPSPEQHQPEPVSESTGEGILSDQASTGHVAAEDVETDVLEEGYSSLLGLSRPAPARQTMIRIEESDPSGPASSEFEPAVVFPGQRLQTSIAPSATPRPFAAPAPEPAPELAGATADHGDSITALRRFDAPVRAAAPAEPAPVDPDQQEETERALRTALATLQRMTSAA